MTGSTDLPRLSWPEVSARRLERQGLLEPASGARPADLAAAMCGAHAQVLSAAELSIALRMAGGTRTEVQAALWSERSLVKTHGPRGTVHLLPTADLPMWTGALSAVPPPASPFPPEVRLTPEQTEQVIEAAGAVTSDAELDIDELTEAIVATTGSWAGDLVMPAFQGMWPRWRQALGAAAHRGALCYGPNRGRRVTYTNPARWLPGFAPADGTVALTELVRRYLRAYGPATPRQFAQWIGGTPGWATRLFESLATESLAAKPLATKPLATDSLATGSLAAGLHQVDFDGTPAWVAAGDTAMPAVAPRGLRLLPYFDAYTIGSQPRQRLFPGRAAERALSPSGQAGNFPVLLVDGTVAGVWHQRRSGRYLDLTVEPLGPLGAKRRRELDEEVDRIGLILDGTPRLTVGPVTVGGHA